MTPVELDEHGFPVLLADVPGSGVSKVDTNAASGNPRHDTRSGKFGEGGQRAQQGPTAPPNADPVEWARFLDAVREAAREFDAPDIGDIQDFLKGRAKDPARVDAEAFLKAVTEQRLADIVDLLDQQMRSGSPMMGRNRRRVQIKAPKGFLKRAISQLDESSLAELGHRLEAMGHDPAEVDAFLKGRTKPEQHDKIDEAKASIQASDLWYGDASEIDMSVLLADDEPSSDTKIEMNFYVSDSTDPEKLAESIEFALKNHSAR